jgi:hypothetical protein
MPVNSRAKGARFERAIANDIRVWLGEDWVVSRNPTDRQCGQDGENAGEFAIRGPHVFPFVIECKSGSGFDARQLFRDPVNGPLEAFWEQACRQADAAYVRQELGAAYRQPLLIARRTRGETLAFMRPAPSLVLAYERWRHRMVIEIGRDGFDGDELHVWRWNDLINVPAIRLWEVCK